MLSHLHALETFGKHINVVTENVRDQRERIKQALQALKGARASLQDILQHGDGERQRINITRVDLPFIESAIKRLEQPTISAPKVSVPPSKFSPVARQIEDAAIKNLADAIDDACIEGPVACGGLLKGDDLDDEGDFEKDPKTGHIKTIKVEQLPTSFIEGDDRKSKGGGDLEPRDMSAPNQFGN